MRYRFEWKKVDAEGWQRIEVSANDLNEALLALRSFITTGLRAYFDQVIVNHIFLEVGDRPEDVVSHSLSDYDTEFSIEYGGIMYGPGAVVPVPDGVTYSI